MVKQTNPYAHINWDKAKVLFDHPITSSDPHQSIQVKDILQVLASVGTIGMMFIFPGAGVALGSLMLGDRQFSRWQTKKVIERLNKQKYVKVAYLEKGRVKVKITKDGLVKALSYQLDDMRINIPKKWDKKWRAVIFDIPEKYKRVRDLFRMRLKQMDLFPLQESVYVSAYPCFDEVEFLRELYGVSMTVRYLLVDKIEDDAAIKSYFNLD